MQKVHYQRFDSQAVFTLTRLFIGLVKVVRGPTHHGDVVPHFPPSGNRSYSQNRTNSISSLLIVWPQK